MLKNKIAYATIYNVDSTSSTQETDGGRKLYFPADDPNLFKFLCWGRAADWQRGTQSGDTMWLHHLSLYNPELPSRGRHAEDGRQQDPVHHYSVSRVTGPQSAGLSLELQTNLCEYRSFTITEKAPTEPRAVIVKLQSWQRFVANSS